MPRWAQSIRFRLSLAYALTVFTTGAVLLAALMLWQMQRLDEEFMVERRALIIEDAATGRQIDTQVQVLTQEDFQVFLGAYEQAVKREFLQEARKASLVGLAVLFIVAFGTGWLMSGWALGPMGRMAAVARNISATELSRRIGMRGGPEDELKDLADTFDEMLDRLQASFEDHRRFVQDASHELRNPLAIAQANLELVLDDPDAGPDELRAAAQVAHASTERLSHIVDDLVTQARHDVPNHQAGEVDLGELVEGVALELDASATSRRISLRTKVDAAADAAAGDGDRAPHHVVVKGDQAALRRAVTNLVVNAIRLAPEGSTVTITAGSEESSAVIAVSDEGPGIDPALHDSVFERFWRGDDAGKGLGLGLSIVRQVAQRHGGDVDLRSTVGVGSTFTIRLPMPISVG